MRTKNFDLELFASAMNRRIRELDKALTKTISNEEFACIVAEKRALTYVLDAVLEACS